MYFVLRYELVDDYLERRTPLRPEHLAEIIDIQLGRLRRLLQDRNITVELTNRAKQLLVGEGYDPAFGARPLKRLIQQRVADPLAVELLQGTVQSGDHVLVDAQGDRLTFTTLAPEEVADRLEPA